MPPQTRTDWVHEIYVAVFPIALPGSTKKAETILAGYQQDPDHINQERVRATVETNRSAVPDLIDMCDTIVAQQAEIDSFRLLKFDEAGLHELDPDQFRPAGEGLSLTDPGAGWRHLA
ncbi:MAG: hypothetical protein ACOCTS_04200 [Thermodesulfobacteriota bacterium]